jgi:hypothetical protein
MKFTVRDLVYIGIFGALWGAVEMALGSYLHVIGAPFTGTIMTALGMVIALVGRLFVPQRGSVLMMGLVTMLLKALSIGGVVANPMIAILAESLLAEAVLLLGGSNRLVFVAAGALATFWNFIHPFFTQGILAGTGILAIYQRSLLKGADLVGLDGGAVGLILLALILVRLIAGAVAGGVAWSLGQQVLARLQMAQPQGDGQ